MSKIKKNIRVILVDDHSTIHREIGALLTTLEGIELVGQGRTGAEAVTLCDEHQPDIVLMDIVMPVLNGIDATKVIMAQRPQTKIIAMSGFDDRESVQAMLAAGAAGYILKTARPEDLANTIRAVYDGNSVLTWEVMQTLLAPPVVVAQPTQDFGLTRRELEILRSMVDGKTNPEIAHLLTVSPSTVKFHTSNILHKLGVETRSAAVALATKQNLV
ncbi:MAG: response regulator transcription factor [Chloroflexota bacterium]